MEKSAATTSAPRRKILRRFITARFSFGLALTTTLLLLLAPRLLLFAKAAPTDAVEGEGECRATDGGSTVCDHDAGSGRDDLAAPDCEDDHESCATWASSGECLQNPEYMMRHCRFSCKNCVESRKTPTINAEPEDLLRAAAEFGEPQRVEGAESVKTLEVIRRTIEYMRTDVHGPNPKHDLPSSVKASCINRNELCAFWAQIGECSSNPAFMVDNCAPVCKSCHLLDKEKRCSLDPNAVDVLQPGDLNRLFERITDISREDYRPTVLSCPVHSLPSNQVESHQTESEHDDGPWVVMLENFLTSDECEVLIELGEVEGYTRSLAGDSVIEGRTSENSWCHGNCYKNPVVKSVVERIANITGIPEANSDYLQMVKYYVGQHYDLHHDYIKELVERQPGVRALTFYLYLNDVEEGGGTSFRMLNNLTITPKQGRAVIWPNVIDSDPNEIDERTYHAALPVWRGKKYGANAWIHMRDFKTPRSMGCV